MDQDMTTIIREPGFVRVAALIRVPFTSMAWRQAHPEVPFWTLLRAFDHATKQDDTRRGIDREAALASFVDLMLPIASADDRLRYSVDDVNWFVSVLESPDAATTLAMLKAYASAPSVRSPLTEGANATQEGESTQQPA